MRLIVGMILILALVVGGVEHGEAQERSSLLPDIPKATGEAHPEGNEYWRKNHMNLLRHDRDLTVRLGEREIEASLKDCVTCHAVTNDAGQIVTYKSEQNFCRVCHDYVAVKVDCFMCHRSTPEGVDEDAFEATLVPQEPLQEADIQGVIAYLGGDNSKLAEAGK